MMKKIGYFDADVVTPEEIFMAAGFTPIRLLCDYNALNIELKRFNMTKS